MLVEEVPAWTMNIIMLLLKVLLKVSLKVRSPTKLSLNFKTFFAGVQNVTRKKWVLLLFFCKRCERFHVDGDDVGRGGAGLNIIIIVGGKSTNG